MLPIGSIKSSGVELMPQYSPKSAARLAECDHHLQILFDEVVKHFDCTVLCGHRAEPEQHAAYLTGKSKLDWPRSKHNKIPSLAVDVAPYLRGAPSFAIDECKYFAGFVMGLATAMNLGHRIRWGGDWDDDRDLQEQIFDDLLHFELI